MSRYRVEARRRRSCVDLYVRDDEGRELGWFDLRKGQVHLAESARDEDEHLLHAVAAGWLAQQEYAELAQAGPAEDSRLNRLIPRRRTARETPAAPTSAFPSLPSTTSTAGVERRLRDHLNLLAEKDSRWHVLHNLETPDAAIQAQHIAMGPAGVFTLRSREFAADVVVRGEQLFCGGEPLPDLARSRAEAERIAAVLEVSLGRVIPVRAVFSPLGPVAVTVERACPQVDVVPRGNLIRWLRSRPVVLDDDTARLVKETVLERSFPGARSG